MWQWQQASTGGTPERAWCETVKPGIFRHRRPNVANAALKAIFKPGCLAAAPAGQARIPASGCVMHGNFR